MVAGLEFSLSSTTPPYSLIGAYTLIGITALLFDLSLFLSPFWVNRWAVCCYGNTTLLLCPSHDGHMPVFTVNGIGIIVERWGLSSHAHTHTHTHTHTHHIPPTFTHYSCRKRYPEDKSVWCPNCLTKKGGCRFLKRKWNHSIPKSLCSIFTLILQQNTLQRKKVWFCNSFLPVCVSTSASYFYKLIIFY